MHFLKLKKVNKDTNLCLERGSFAQSKKVIARKNKFGYQSGINSFINWDSFFSIPLMSRYKQVLQTKKNL